MATRKTKIRALISNRDQSILSHEPMSLKMTGVVVRLLNRVAELQQSAEILTRIVENDYFDEDGENEEFYKAIADATKLLKLLSRKGGR